MTFITRSRSAVSLVEALVGLAILSVVGLAVVAALSSSAKEMKATSEYSLSLFIVQKVAEELVQGGYENPRADQAIEELAGNRMDLENPLNPYFATIEDSATDYGIMEAGKDFAVEPSTGVLHRLYRDFNLTLVTDDQPVAPAPGSPDLVKLVDIQYDWPGLKQGTRDLSFPLILAKSCIQPLASPDITEDSANFDQQVARVIYPDLPAGQTLLPYVGSLGGNVTAVRDLGSILVVTYYAYQEMRVHDDAIAALEVQQAASPNDPEIEIQLGREHERKAAIAWQSLYFNKDPARRMSTSFSAGDLGNPGLVDRVMIHTEVSRAILLEQWFEFELARALQCYISARSKMTALSPRPYRLLMLEKKVLELAELQVMASGSSDTSFLERWNDAMLDLYVGRNRSMGDFYTRERSHAGSLPQVRDAHPGIRDRLDDTDLGQQALTQLQGRVASELF